MRFFEASGAQYIHALEAQRVKVSRKKNVRRTFKKTLVSAITTLLSLVVLVSSLQLSSLSVLALSETDPNDGSSEASEKLNSIMEGHDLDQKGFEDLIVQGNQEGPNSGSFASVINRLFSLGYSNNVSLASGSPSNGYYCNVNNKANGTLVYHNCDVPNILTEFVQDLVSLFLPSGAYNAEIQSATMMNPGFGIPTSLIPGETVQINRSTGTPKYTALEIYGYGIKYSGYLGEWDHIKVMTESRMLSNFGLMDHLALGGNAVWNSTAAVVNSVQDASSQFSQDLASGDVIGAFGGFFGSIFNLGEVALSTAVNTIFDTSDYNVITQNAWYRINFGNTAYGTRQLTSLELSAEALSSLTRLIDDSVDKNEEAALPPDFPPASLPEKPLDAISSCEVLRYSGGDWGYHSYGSSSTPPGVSEASCISAGERSVELAPSDADEPSGASYVFDPEGTQALETIEAWVSKHSGIFAGIEKYNINCTIDTSESNRTSNINSFYNCYHGDWQRAADITLDKEKIKNNTTWRTLILSGFIMSKWMSENQDANFNAAFNRFVCVDSNGKTTKDSSGRFLRVYNSDGSLTGNCSGTRPPIQDGLFGNGYIVGQPGQNVEQDTRREAFQPNLFSAPHIGTDFANFSLAISSFTTQISNTALILSFAPILDSLGIRDIVVNIIESFRDGIFFPLAALIAAFGAITAFVRFVKSKAFTEAITSMIYIVLSFIMGVILLIHPDKTIKFVDEAPMMIENTILSAFYGSTNDDLCTATGTPGNDNVQGISSVVSNQKNVVRTMTCETWRTFVFTPWVYGQWGTGYESLYSKGNASGVGTNGVQNTALDNSNQAIVGDAAVNFGGGKIIKNWAVYQLATQSAGTTTHPDPSRATGLVDKNWYKIVDAQAGPNNGANSDGTYFESWSGQDLNNRLSVAFFSPAVSILGAITIVTYSLLKISLSIMTVILLILLPIMLLMGIHPTFGRRQLKSYAWQIIGLMIQRILITLILAIMLRVVISVAGATSGYIITALVTLVLLFVFLTYRSEILGLVQKAMDSSAGAFMGGMGYQGVSSLKEYVPTQSIDNAMSMTKTKTRGAAAGLAAGAISGGSMDNRVRLMKENMNVSSQREENKQIKQGLGLFQRNQQVKDAVERDLAEEYNSDKMFRARNQMLKAASPNQFDEHGNYIGSQDEGNKGERIDHETLELRNINKDGVAESMSDKGPRKVGSTTHDRQQLLRLNKIESALQKIEDKTLKSQKSRMKNDINSGLDVANISDTEKMKTMVEQNLGKDMSQKYEKLLSKRESITAAQSKIYENEFSKSERRAERKEALNDLLGAFAPTPKKTILDDFEDDIDRQTGSQ